MPKPEEDDGIKPLSERLVTELTAHRTLALRNALGERSRDRLRRGAARPLPQRLLPITPTNTCLEIDAKSAGFLHQAPGLAEYARRQGDRGPAAGLAEALAARERTLCGMRLSRLDARAGQRCSPIAPRSRSTPCMSPFSRSPTPHGACRRDRRGGRPRHGCAGWTPTVENYLGRVTKARILDAVREAKGDAAAQLIDHLKKPEMAKEAERLLAGTGWLPEPLRLPDAGNRRADRPRLPMPQENLPAFLPTTVAMRRPHPGPRASPPNDIEPRGGGLRSPRFFPTNLRRPP